MVWNRPMTRRELVKKVGKYSAAGSMLYFLAACNSRGSVGTSGDYTGELSLLLGSHMDYLQALGPVYNENYGVDPSFEFVTTPDLKNTLTSSFLARTSPWDVSFITAEVAAEMADNGWLKELTERVKDMNDRPIIEGAFEAVAFNNQQYAVPVTTGCPILLWNKKMFEDAGLDPSAPETWHSTENSWDTMVEYAKEMTREVNGTRHYGLVDAWAGDHVLWTFGSLVQMHGGDLLNEDNQPVMNSEEGIEALQKMVDLLHTHKCIDPASTTYTWVFDASPGFTNGTRGMIMTWPFMVGVANHGDDSQIKGQVGFAPNPSVKTSASVDGSEFLAIPSFSENIEEAWRYIELVTSYEKQKEQGANTEWLPIYTELLEDPDVVQMNPAAPIVKQAYEYPTKGYRSSDYSRWSEILSNEIHSALEQNKTPKEALDEAVKEINRVRG